MSSASLSARDLRTLRRLVRTSTLFPFSETEFFGDKNQKPSTDPVYFMFTIGGEDLNTSSRRRLRQSIQSIPSKFNLPLNIEVTLRSGRGERQDYRLIHPSFAPFRSLLEGKGVALYAKISSKSVAEPIPVNLNLFFVHRRNVFRLELGIELELASKVVSVTSKNGPSSRFFRISFPASKSKVGVPNLSSFNSNTTVEFNTSSAVALRSKDFSKILTNQLPSVYESVAPHLVQNSAMAVVMPAIPARAILQTLSLIINLFKSQSDLTTTLAPKGVTRWYSGCARRLQIFVTAVRIRLESR
jgi:hypothetical protein